MKRITNTQYLKVGYQTNVGTVQAIYDNQSFLSSDGFSYHLAEYEIYITAKSMKPTHHFEIERIDFTVKRLGLTHNPKTQNTIAGGSFNEIGKQIVKFRKSFIPKFKTKSA